MDSILTKNLNLKSYIKIVVNVSKPLWSGEGEEIKDHEEQKIYSAGVPHQSIIGFFNFQFLVTHVTTLYTCVTRIFKGYPR